MERVLARQRWWHLPTTCLPTTRTHAVRTPTTRTHAVRTPTTRTHAVRLVTAMLATAMVAAAGAITLAFVPAAPAQAQDQEPAPSGCLTAEYAAHTWNAGQTGGGFITGITLTNTCEETVQGWTVQLTLPQDHELVSGWGATWTATDGTVTGTATHWNDEVRPGRSIVVGFLGTFAGAYQDPLTCTINGSACAGYGPDPDENLPPEVEITSPADGATFNYPCGATLRATAQDPDGEVDRVEFYVNEQLVASDDTAPYEVEAPYGGFGGFTNVAYARAFDDGDPPLSTDSDPVSFMFAPPPPVPPGGTSTPILNCIDSLEVEEGGSRVVTYSNVCGAPGEWTITMIVDGDPAITVDPETFTTQGGQNLTISAAPGSAGATATVSTQGGCSSASVEVTVVPASG